MESENNDLDLEKKTTITISKGRLIGWTLGIFGFLIASAWSISIIYPIVNELLALPSKVDILLDEKKLSDIKDIHNTLLTEYGATLIIHFESLRNCDTLKIIEESVEQLIEKNCK